MGRPGRHDPVHIRFSEEWKPGNSLFDWYAQRSGRTITRMQKRKEKRGPFFHEYIVIQLDNKEMYRIDRRPDQKVVSPIGSVTSKGVPASDTLQQITSFESNPHRPEESISLLEIEFQASVQLQLILHILHAIHAHPKARAYTVCLYNCYFFARVIAYCITRSVREKYRTDVKDIQFPPANNYWKAITPDPQVENPDKQSFAPINGGITVLNGTLRKQAPEPVKVTIGEPVGFNPTWHIQEFDPNEPSLVRCMKYRIMEPPQAKTAQLLTHWHTWLCASDGQHNRIKSFIKGIHNSSP